MLYTDLIGNQLQNTMVVFIMRDSVPSARYSRVCNVLRLWRIWLIPTYRVYWLYDLQRSCAEGNNLYTRVVAELDYKLTKDMQNPQHKSLLQVGCFFWFEGY